MARNVRQEMADAMPRYYDGSYVIGNVLDREAAEMDALNTAAYDVLAQFYVDTATWGLSRWERICGIVTDVSKPIEQRRSVVRSKLRGMGTVTVAMIKNVAEAFDNGDVSVAENVKNALPPFSDSAWTLYGKASALAKFTGKVSGSTVENPHIMRRNSGDTVLVSPYGAWSENNNTQYSAVMALDGNTVPSVTSLVNGQIAEHCFSFDLINHVIQKYGASIFGTATTTADRVAWLKANLTSLTANWHGYGAGPSGNKSSFAMWSIPANGWINVRFSTNGTTTLHSIVSDATYAANYKHTDLIDANGMVHYIAYTDASNGTTASTIYTDYVELEVGIKTINGIQPNAIGSNYTLTLNATSADMRSSIAVGVVPGQTYTFSAAHNGEYLMRFRNAGGTTTGSTTTHTSASATRTAPNDAASVVIELRNPSASPVGTFTFTNPQLERSDVATAFEPKIAHTISVKFISSRGVPSNLSDIQTALRDIIPAHLAINFLFTFLTYGELVGAGLTFGGLEAQGLTFGALETWDPTP